MTLGRHVWVRKPFGATYCPGLVMEWAADEREARVIFVEDDGRVVTAMVERPFLTVVQSQPFTGSAYG